MLKTYDKDYYSGKGFDEENRLLKEYLEKPKWKANKWQGKLLGIQRFIDKGKILDVGCAFGEFLDVLAMEGWDVYGLEPSGFSGKHIKERLGKNVVIDTFKRGLFPKGSFDVITMTEVIEHVYNPLEYLLTANSYLKKNGLIVIQTCDVESGQVRRKGAKWSYYIPPAHVYYFSRRTLDKALKKVGFRLLFTVRGGEVKTLKALRFLGMDRTTDERRIIRKLKVFLTFLSYRLFFMVSKVIGYPGMTIYARKIKDIDCV
jgi:2-polyprenyl-3-methyl-5-hydroxy-6-metoxy-1,4-benzoquinol methylase